MKNIKNEKGMALAIVIIIFAIVTITASAALSISLSDTKLSVANENYIQAHYVARSAADVVSEDINLKMKKLEKLANDIPGLTGAALQNAKDAHSDYIAELQGLGVPLVNGQSTTLKVGNISSNLAEVKVENNNGITIVTAMYEEDGRIGKSTVKLGSVTPATITFTIPSFSGNNVIYTWGNITGTINNVKDITVSGAGIISSGAPTPASIELDNVHYNDKRGVAIMPPPPEYPFNGSAISSNYLISQKKKDVVNIDKNNNGYYGSLSATGNQTINWEVDTSKGDVVLIFNSINVGNQADILVKGSGHLYIYFVEKNNSNLMNFGNGLNIKSKVDDVETTGGGVKTTLVAYTKYMQDWYTHPSKIADGTNKFIPPELVATMPSAEVNFGVDLSKPQTAANNMNADAFMYFPGATVLVGNNLDLTGVLYAGSLYFGNNATVTINPFNTGNSIFTNNPSTSGEPEIVTVNTYDWELKKIWIR